MKASDLFVKSLENEGVEYIFAVPGEENLDVLESLRESSIKLILTRHEQGAGFMAATYGRLTGKLGVCMATLGPGATNFVTCAAYAHLAGLPVLFITGQKPIKSSKQAKFQIIDVVRMMEPITKHTKQIVNCNNIPAHIREVFRIAEEEKPGPVHLELPEDIAAEETLKTNPFAIVKIENPEATKSSIKIAADMIRKANMPLVLFAAGTQRKGNYEALTKLINETGLYFCNTQMGKGVVPEDHPNFLGTAALSSDDYLHCAINRADLIINIGHDVVEKPPFFMTKGGMKVIHINYSKAEMDQVYFPHHEVVGDISSSVEYLTELLGKGNKWDNTYFDRIKKEIEENVYGKSNDDRFPNIPQKIIGDVREAMRDEDIIALDNGMYKIWFARCYKAHMSNTVLLDNALATMGAGLPSAMAAKLVYPDRNVVAICGDGGFMMNSQELETALRMKLNITVIVLRDNSYGMIRWKQGLDNFEDWGLEFGNPDFVKYAESYGAFGHRVTKNGELLDVLKKTFKTPGVHLIEVPIDYSVNDSLTKELSEKICLL